jgi:hypothetical protein
VLAIDWNGDGDFSDTGEDVTARTLRCEWKRGADFASQLVGKAVAGTLTAVLNNESGDYSPFNAASPLAGNLVPGRKVRLTGNDGTTTFSLWSGFLDSIEPIPSANGPNRARLKAIGALGYLNKFEVSTALFADTATGTLIGAVLDAAGWPADDRDIDAGLLTLPYFWTQRVPTLKALRLIEETETAMLEEDASGKVVYRDRHARSKDARSAASQATYSDASGAALAYSGVKQIDPLKFIYNELRAQIQLYSVSSAATLWTHPESGSASPSIAAGETKTFTALYPSSGTASTSKAVAAWTTLAATTDYLANDQADGTGTNRTADITVSLTKRAQSMDIALTNGHSGTVYLTKLQARGTKLEATDPVEVSAADSTSQTSFGKRTFPHPGKFISTVSEGQDWAEFHVAVWKDPVPLLEMVVTGNRSTATLTDIFTREISDLITLTAEGAAGLGINETFFIEQLSHRLDAQLNHRVKYTLSQASGYSGFWVLGSAALGITTRLAY